MDVEPRARRKAELLWILHPETGANLYFPPQRSPEGFAGRLVMPSFYADAMIFDYPWSRRPRFANLPSRTQWHLHEYRLRTTPTDESQRSPVFDVIHPHLFHELEAIVTQCINNTPYQPSPLPTTRTRPYRRNSSLPYRASEGWRNHSGIAREQLMVSLHDGVLPLSCSLYDEHIRRLRLTGTPSSGDGNCVERRACVERAPG